ncbi:AHH domain-containing protein, partial [Vibrio coralliilyticus]
MGILNNQEAAESDFVDGMIEKKGYRKRWVNNVKSKPDHPFNNGIHMDTHHLISAEAVKISKLGKNLVNKGYDINLLSNLVGFPATLPGACQLHCQLHRGDHTFSRPGEKPYHDYVSGQLTDPEIKKSIKKCNGKTKETVNESAIHKLLDPI